MALTETGIDFSKEDWNEPAEFFDGCWVIANLHSPSLNQTMQLNNRTFVFRVKNKAGQDVLLVFGCAAQPAVDAVEKLARETGLEVAWVISNGGGHHMFLDLWYQAFPGARIPIPAKRIPFTRNGERLKAKYADRWELLEGPKPAALLQDVGGDIDVVIFDQLFGYKDTTSAEAFDGGALDHTSKPTAYGGFTLMKRFPKLMSDTSQPNDEVCLFHRKSGLVIGGHNFPFSYSPKGYHPPAKFQMKAGPFPLNLMMKMSLLKPGNFASLLEGQPGPVADSKRHLEAWEAVLDWDIRAWTTAHDPPTIGGPDMDGAAIKAAVRASLARSGEDDPSGARLKWNVKHA